MVFFFQNHFVIIISWFFKFLETHLRTMKHNERKDCGLIMWCAKYTPYFRVVEEINSRAEINLL